MFILVSRTNFNSASMHVHKKALMFLKEPMPHLPICQKKWKLPLTLHPPCSCAWHTNTLLTLEYTFKGSHGLQVKAQNENQKAHKQLGYLTAFMTSEEGFNSWKFCEGNSAMSTQQPAISSAIWRNQSTQQWLLMWRAWQLKSFH